MEGTMGPGGQCSKAPNISADTKHRTLAMEDPIEADMVSDAIHMSQIATSVGIDLRSPADLRKLPNGALRQLANILQQ
eukprot:8175470-Karenia_brevis.AAC.1